MDDFTSLTADYAECPLHWLVYSDHYLPQFQARLRNLDPKDVDGNTLLQEAAMSQMNNRRILRLLIIWGADVNLVNEDRSTPLHLAVCSRNLANVDALLGAGACANKRDSYGHTPLHLSVCKRYSHSTFPFPIRYCDLSIVKRLLRHPSIRFNVWNQAAETPLLLAVRQWNSGAVRVLLRKGADPNIPDFNRQTPLHVALSSRLVSTSTMAKIALTLLEEGAGIYCRDSFQLTPIDILLDNVLDDESMLVFAARCLKKIAFQCNVRESLRSKLIPIPYLDHSLSACCEEVVIMRQLIIRDHGTLHDFAFGWIPTEMEDPVEDVYRPVVEMLVFFRFPIYCRCIARHLSRSCLGEVLKRCLGMPSDFELEPNRTEKSLFIEIRRLYNDDERLRMRLQRFNHLL